MSLFNIEGWRHDNSRGGMMSGERVMRHGLVAVALFAGYLGWGMLTPWFSHQQRIAEVNATLVAQQAALSRYKAVNSVINATMAEAMGVDPWLARVRVAFIHPPATRDNLPLIRWDLTNAVTRPGHVVGELRVDQPISDWSDYLDSLLSHRCARRYLADMTEQAPILRMGVMRIAGFVVCPIVSPRGALVGAVFGSWDVDDPEPPDFALTERHVREAATKIGAAIQPEG